jgi:hypothetical protein
MFKETFDLRVLSSSSGISALAQRTCEKTSSQGGPRHRTDAEMLTKTSVSKKRRQPAPAYLEGGDDFTLVLTVNDVVVVLHRYERRQLVLDGIV